MSQSHAAPRCALNPLLQFGFRLMEALGALSYTVWQRRLRRNVAQLIAANGAWQGPLPPLDPRTRSRWSLALAAAASVALAGLLVWQAKA